MPQLKCYFVFFLTLKMYHTYFANRNRLTGDHWNMKRQQRGEAKNTSMTGMLVTFKMTHHIPASHEDGYTN